MFPPLWRYYQNAMFLRSYCEPAVGRASLTCHPRAGLYTSHLEQKPGGGACTEVTPLPAVRMMWRGERRQQMGPLWTVSQALCREMNIPAADWLVRPRFRSPRSHQVTSGYLLTREGLTYSTLTSPHPPPAHVQKPARSFLTTPLKGPLPSSGGLTEGPAKVQ